MRSSTVEAVVAVLLLGAVGSAAEDVVGYDGFPIGRVVPKPRKIQYSDEQVTLWEGRPKACVVVAKEAHPALKLAARELAARPGRIAMTVWPGIAGAMPRLEIVSDAGAAKRFPIAIVLAVDQAAGVAVPKHVGREGYIVTWRRSGEQRTAYCVGADARGVYYGAQSLQQLMDTQERRIRLRVAEIEDWPAFGIRCSGNDGSIPGGEGVCERAVEWLPHLKLNGWAVGQSYIWPDNWRETPKGRLDALKRACRKARETDVLDVIFQIHPFRGRQRDRQFNMVICDPSDVEAFVGLCDEMLAAGAKGINFRADDYHPLSPPDQKRFGGKAEAHIWLIDEMHRRLKARHPDYYLIFCPPFYHGTPATTMPERRAYMQKLAVLPKDIHIMWTGPVTRSLEITREQIAAYKALIGRDPFLWDNTVYAHRSRYGYSTRHPGYLFDAFATRYPDDYGTTCPGIRYNWGYGDAVTTKAGNINIADYLWNPAGYEPEPSLRQALAILAGERAVDHLVAFREAYYEIKDAQDAGKSSELAVFEKMRRAAADLPAIAGRIRASSPSLDVAELVADRQRAALAMFARSKAAMGQMLAARQTCLVDLDFSQPAWREKAKGKWTVRRDSGSVRFSFPSRTRSFGGALGRIRAEIAVPKSPTGRYYLLFSAYDDYTAMGTPSSAWPGYLCKQVLLDDEVVWEDDVEGREPPDQEAMQIIDVTERLRRKKTAAVAFRGFDKRGVGNMGARIRFANACLVAGPCELLSSAIEIPDCPALRSLDAFTIIVSFTPRQVGKRTLLYAKQKPMQYFAYQHESGHVAAGVHSGSAETSLLSKGKVKAGARSTLAFVFDAGRLSLFLNGVLQSEKQLDATIDAGNGPLTVGSYSSTQPFFEGVIQELQFYKRALSADELAHARPSAQGVGEPKDVTVNGSCEQLDGKGMPVGWSSASRPRDGKWGPSNDARSGKRAVFVSGRVGESDRSSVSGGLRLAHARVDARGHPAYYEVEPNTVYRVSLWAKGDAGRILIAPRANPGPAPGHLDLARFPFWVGEQWKRLEATFATRANTRGLMILIDVPESSGDGSLRTLYVDDLTLEQFSSGLVGWWSLDDAGAVAARDRAGACPDGAIYRHWKVTVP